MSPVKTKVALPPVPVDEPEAEEEEEEEVDADAEDAEADAEAEEEAEDAEEEEEEEEEERDWVLWRRRGANYWHDQISHEVYTCLPDDSVGDLVGKYVLVNGIASLAPA